MERIGFLCFSSLLLLAAARGEDLRVYPEPGGLHVVAADLTTTASYRVSFYDGASTQSVTLGADGEAWAWGVDPTPRLLTVTLMRGNEEVLRTTEATGDPLVTLAKDEATSKALVVLVNLVLARQKEAVLGKFKGSERVIVEQAFDSAKVDSLGAMRAAGMSLYVSEQKVRQANAVSEADKLDRKLSDAKPIAIGDKR